MDYEAILTEAYEAADAAIKAKFDKGDREHPFNCGFAWVIIDGKEPLANYCRTKLKANQQLNGRRIDAIRYGDKGYPRGWQFWKPGSWPANAPQNFQQDRDFWVAGARAFARVLEDHGVHATVGSRLD